MATDAEYESDGEADIQPWWEDESVFTGYPMQGLEGALFSHGTAVILRPFVPQHLRLRLPIVTQFTVLVSITQLGCQKLEVLHHFMTQILWNLRVLYAM